MVFSSLIICHEDERKKNFGDFLMFELQFLLAKILSNLFVIQQFDVQSDYFGIFCESLLTEPPLEKISSALELTFLTVSKKFAYFIENVNEV